MYHRGIYQTCEYQGFIFKNVGVDSSSIFVGYVSISMYLSIRYKTARVVGLTPSLKSQGVDESEDLPSSRATIEKRLVV